MKKYQNLSAVFLAGILAICFPLAASANSSWVWISDTRPFDVLPYVVIGTLLVETLGIGLIPRFEGKKMGKVFCVVCVGNLLSFVAPYLLRWMFGIGLPFAQTLDFHNYTVGAVYLVLTVVIELAVGYFLLRKDTERKKTLIAAIVGCNVVTTVAVAIVERTLCQGYWV